MKRTKRVLIFSNAFGSIECPGTPHKDRAFGGHLMISPFDDGKVYNNLTDLLDENSLLFHGYHLLCAVAEKIMLEQLPSLNGSMSGGRKGVVNLFEAGNWQLHFYRKPVGNKDASSKHVHTHMYGRSPLEPCLTNEEKMLHWGWGEAPFFPEFMETPFSPERPGKKWVIPQGFNKKEIKQLKNAAVLIAEKINWPKMCRLRN